MASHTRPPSKTPSYLQPTASTAQRAASSAQSKRTRPTTRHTALQSRAPLECKTTSGTSQGGPNPSASKSREAEARARTAQTVHSLPAEDRITPTEPPHDTLQVAAQVQSWLFMHSNLQRSLSIVQKGAQDSHYALAEATSNDTDLGSSTTRWNAENLVVFLDDLAKAGPSAHLTLFIHRFLEHEKSWYKLQSELTQFVARLSQAPTDSPLEEGQNLKARLGEESLEIASLLAEIESWNDETNRVHHTLAQLDPILRARSDNISIASDAIDCSLDNIRAMRRLRA